MSRTRSSSGWMVETGSIERFDQKNQMLDHMRWPLQSSLLIKRDAATGRHSEYGILRVIRGRVEPVVYRKDASWVVEERYGDFNDLLDDGWRVN